MVQPFVDPVGGEALLVSVLNYALSLSAISDSVQHLLLIVEAFQLSVLWDEGTAGGTAILSEDVDQGPHHPCHVPMHQR